MSKKIVYRQCALEHREQTQYTGELVITHYTAWIPNQFAKVGNKVDLWFDEGKQWIRGWVVKQVGEAKDEEYVLDHERDYTRQRAASDI